MFRRGGGSHPEKRAGSTKLFFPELSSIAASTASFRLPEVSFCSVCVPHMRSPDVLHLLPLRTVCAILVRCRWRAWAVLFSPTESSYHGTVCDSQLKSEVHLALQPTCLGQSRTSREEHKMGVLWGDTLLAWVPSL